MNCDRILKEWRRFDLTGREIGRATKLLPDVSQGRVIKTSLDGNDLAVLVQTSSSFEVRV